MITRSMCLLAASLQLLLLSVTSCSKKQEFATPGVRKIKDVVIYSDSLYYSTFPSVVKKKNGEILVAFRRAPDRRMLGEQHLTHTDPNSYLVSVTSKDGEDWSARPKLMYAHPYGGSQDPCMIHLRDGTMLCTSYAWAFQTAEGRSTFPNRETALFTGVRDLEATFIGGFLLRSDDQGDTWDEYTELPAISPQVGTGVFGQPLSIYNRGAMLEARDGNLYWVVAVIDDIQTGKTSNHLVRSQDKGETWEYMSEVAKDDSVYFNEASLYETPKGDLVAFIRSEVFNEMAVIARSTDGGRSFKWESMGFEGRPLNALGLPDGRVLLTYGYRSKPYGIRARILNAECTDLETAPEIILRDDGGNSDIGYSWPVHLEGNRFLVTYYFNVNNGVRHIAGTILEIDPIK